MLRNIENASLDYIDIESKRNALIKHLDLSEYVDDNNLLMGLLIHVRLISRQQIVNVGLSQKESVSMRVNRLVKRGFLRALDTKGFSVRKVYTLTAQGAGQISVMPSMNALADSFREIRKLSGYIDHRLRSYDLYLAFLCNPSIESVEFYREEEFVEEDGVESRSNVALRIDGKLLVDGREFWVEQDMATLSLNNLRQKVSRMDQNLTGKESIIFSVCLDDVCGKLTETDSKRFRTQFKKLEAMDALVSFMRDTGCMGADVCKKRLQALSLENNHDRALVRRNDSLIAVLDEYGFNSPDEYVSVRKRLSEQLENQRLKLIGDRMDEAFATRCKTIYKALFDYPKEEGLIKRALNGLDVYVVQNRDVNAFLHMDYFDNGISNIERAKLCYEAVFRERLTNYVSFGRSFDDLFSLANMYGGYLAIEDYHYNLSARKRLSVAFERVNVNSSFTFVVIVDNLDDVQEIADAYNLERLSNTSVRVLFALRQHLIYRNNAMYGYGDGVIIEYREP